MPATTPSPEPNTEISDLIAGGELSIATGLGGAEIIDRLRKAGRRGKLPGFDSKDARAFRLDCDAVPFEHELRGSIVDQGESGAVVRVRLARKPVIPAVFAITLVLTVWPGVWLTDSLMATYWSAYGRWAESMPWLTYAWYLPTTALPLPWMWRSLVRKSRAGAAESAGKILPVLRDLLGTEPVGP
ncbi:MAG: hypothetical protein IPJ41_13695 [Phycisphaerales bacterium]|nr:hypothetical protein [Phycisphaerales bacterium]